MLSSIRPKVLLPLSFVLTALLMLGVVARPVWADLLPSPSGQIILTIDGNIANTTDGSAAQFDRAQLEALGLRELSTSNPFVEGLQHYEGILFSDLLDLVGAEGSTVVATALDGYSIDIPIEDVRAFPIIVAIKWNGKIMRVRNKGPLWIVYPVDQYEDLQSETYSARSIWQLSHLTIK